jgi:hypothetical protein
VENRERRVGRVVSDMNKSGERTHHALKAPQTRRRVAGRRPLPPVPWPSARPVVAPGTPLGPPPSPGVSSYLDSQARADIERLEIKLRDGVPLTASDYDGEEGNATWLVVDGVAHFDSERGKWQIAYTMDDVNRRLNGARGQPA